MTKPTLLLSELNAIADEFGIVFERSTVPSKVCVYAKHIDSPISDKKHGRDQYFRIGKIDESTAIRGMLADRCEDAGLRWAEPIRLGRQGVHSIWYGEQGEKVTAFTLVD